MRTTIEALTGALVESNRTQSETVVAVIQELRPQRTDARGISAAEMAAQQEQLALIKRVQLERTRDLASSLGLLPEGEFWFDPATGQVYDTPDSAKDEMSRTTVVPGSHAPAPSPSQ